MGIFPYSHVFPCEIELIPARFMRSKQALDMPLDGFSPQKHVHTLSPSESILSKNIRYAPTVFYPHPLLNTTQRIRQAKQTIRYYAAECAQTIKYNN